MDQKVRKILSGIQSPSMLDILEFHGKSCKYDSYSNNSHSSGKIIDANELEQFCRRLFIDYRNYLLQCDQKSNLTGVWKSVVETLKSDSYNPDIMDKRSGMPYYKLLYSDFRKIFGDKIPYIAELQSAEDISKGQGDFLHVFSYIGNGLKREPIDVRLYLNLKTENILKFSNEFYVRSKKMGLPGYFKFYSSDKNKNDTWLVYSSYSNMDKYINIIEDIKRDRPELFVGSEKVSCNMARLNGHIGFGEEPMDVDANGKSIDYSDGYRYSYNERLGLVTDEIFKQLRSKLTNRCRDCLVGCFADNKEMFGNTGVSFKQYLDRGISPVIEKSVDAWLKTSNGIGWLNQSKYRSRETLISNIKSRFEKNFVNYLIKGEPLDNITENSCEGLIVPIARCDIEGYLKKAHPDPKQFTNRTILRGWLSTYALFKESQSEQAIKLHKGMYIQIRDWLQEELRKDSNNPTYKALYNELCQGNGDASPTGKALEIIAAAGFVSFPNGDTITLKCGNKIINIADKINKYKLYEYALGKECIQKIAREECHKKNIDFNRVCFNETTVSNNHIPIVRANFFVPKSEKKLNKKDNQAC